jgi:flavorubredoxin/NADPH-dependent 2,4-dienoyl-CoA reductase/sulfur reductase-like enzyme
MKTKQLKDDLYWVGNQDPELRVFDILMHTEFGTSYNSYVLKGSEKTVVFEASKAKFTDAYLDKLTGIVPLAEIDYLIMSHTEPDHTGTIERMLELNPKLKLVGTTAAIGFMKEICNRDFAGVTVKEGDRVSLGNKTLRFIMAPNLHWPDTMFTYVEEDGLLVTCDCFGAHYSLEGVTNDTIPDQDDYFSAMKYYFDGIVSPFKSFALSAVKKIEGLKINMILTGHGPVLIKDPLAVVEQYRQWSTETNPNAKKTVIIPYVSAYGYTETLAKKISEGIQAFADIDVRLYDMVYADKQTVVDELYWADGILFGTPTMVGEALKPIWDLTTSIFAKTHGRKIASAFGSYGWSGEGVPNIMERLKQLGMKLYGEGLSIRFKPNEAQLQEAFEFGYGFGASVDAGKIVDVKPPAAEKVRVWQCLVCGYVHEGDAPPDACPVCGVGPDQFTETTPYDTGFVSEKAESFIIIGNGAAGTTACEEIRKRNRKCAIEIVSSEDSIGYNRPMLTKGILSEVDPVNFYIKPAEWYQQNNIKLTLGVTVKEIRKDAKEIALANGEIRKYDRLILATGAEAFIPPIKGADQEGVTAIRSLAGVKKLQETLKHVTKAAVIGGGILGLEAAWELKKAGKDVTVVEQSPNIMNKQLDEKGSALLKAAAEKSGIRVITGKGIEEIKGSGKAAGVKLADGTLAEADLVIVSTGVKQNIELAKAIGIETGRSIKVNERMETSEKDIYACGDCAEYNGMNYAIWGQAVEMGKTAGINAVGDEYKYEAFIPSNAFSGMGTSLFAVGDNGKDPEKAYKTFEIYDGAKNTYEKLYFVNNRFCGGILMGDVSKSARLLLGYKNQDPITKFQLG